MNDLKWIKKAMVLGLSFFLAVLIIKPIGVSTQFSVLSGIIHNTFDSELITENPQAESGYESTNAYYNKSGGSIAKNIKNPINYGFIFVLAIPLGAYAGFKLTNKEKVNDKKTNIKKNNILTVEKGFIQKYAASFVSGFLLIFGARMAGGCTSGHMMSGIMQGSVSGFIFAGAVFIVAIPVAMFVSNKNHKERVGL